MGWAEELPNGTWRAIWRDATGRKRSKAGFKKEADAVRHAGWVEERVKRGESVTSGRAPTWAGWAQEWWPQRVVEAATLRQDEIRLNRYLMPYWGRRRLNKITRGEIQAWVNELSDTPRHVDPNAKKPDGRKLAPATVDRIYRLFSASMKAAVLDGRIPGNPCVGVKLPEAGEGHERYLTRAEVDLVLHNIDERYQPVIILLAGTGMRFGELAGLHWQRVDLENGRIDIVETWDSAARQIKAYPKGKARRSVPVTGWVRTALEGLLDARGKEPARSCGLPHAGTVRCQSGLVVTAPGGGPLDAHNVGQRAWASAVANAGLGHARLHDLRHSYASWLRQAGVDLEEVQRLLGHASITTTQRYSHLGASQHERVLAALS